MVLETVPAKSTGIDFGGCSPGAEQVLALNLGLLSCENSFAQVGLDTFSGLSKKTTGF